MEIQRRIIVPAVKFKNELIPVWDKRITYGYHEDYGDYIKVDDEDRRYDLIECIFDLKTKNLDMGIILDYYPTDEELPFHNGEQVYFEEKHKTLKLSTIVDIMYEEYELQRYKGKKLDEWWKNRFSNITFEDNQLYAIKIWKPIYVLDDGRKVEYDYQLYHVA